MDVRHSSAKIEMLLAALTALASLALLVHGGCAPAEDISAKYSTAVREEAVSQLSLAGFAAKLRSSTSMRDQAKRVMSKVPHELMRKLDPDGMKTRAVVLLPLLEHYALSEVDPSAAASLDGSRFADGLGKYFSFVPAHASSFKLTASEDKHGTCELKAEISWHDCGRKQTEHACIRFADGTPLQVKQWCIKAVVQAAEDPEIRCLLDEVVNAE